MGTEETPILDLGCGRGEWLELLRRHGLCGRGIEVNRGFLSRCQERELEVAEGDGLTHLRTLPPASLGGVAAFRVIEYLPLATLEGLLDEVVRVLKPGELALFETPNPQFLLVSSLFHADPTHQRLLTPETLQFLAQQPGLTRVEVQTLNERASGRSGSVCTRGWEVPASPSPSC